MDLDDALRALGATPRATALRNQLAKARGNERNAYAVCAGTDTKRAMKELQGAVRALARLRKLFAAKAARTIPARAERLSTVDQLRQDMRTLRSTLVCPRDVAAP
jgi:hypothetical protein